MEDLFALAFSLFLLMDPVGNVPVFASLLKNLSPKRQLIVILREMLIALTIIIIFSFIGNRLLTLLKISQETLLISGGIILFLIALRMIFPRGKESAFEEPEGGEPLIVPLAIPLVAGPSVLASVMIYAHRNIEASSLTLVGAICIAWVASTLILLMCSFLKKILGVRGITALERLMGLILTLLSIQMLLEGLSLFMKNPS